MAKSASKASGAGSRKASDKTSKAGGAAKSPKTAPRKAVAVRTRADGNANESGAEEQSNAAVEMFLKLLQSPVVADLLAVAATAALAALAEHGFNRGGAAEGKGAGRAVKAAGKAAAAAVGRRLATEVEEIRRAAKSKSAEA